MVVANTVNAFPGLGRTETRREALCKPQLILGLAEALFVGAEKRGVRSQRYDWTAEVVASPRKRRERT
jgi:hypothetical protein